MALGDTLFHYLTAVVALGVVALLGLFTYELFYGASSSIQTFGIAFLSSGQWDPVTSQFGAWPTIYGTLVTSALALMLGVPVSLGTAIFLTELCPRVLREPLSFIVELLAAVPSVIFGLWGLFVLSPYMRTSVEPAIQGTVGAHVGFFTPLGFLSPLFSGTPIGVDKLTAGVILAIMIIPTVSAISREAFRQVPQSQREAALSLGATQWETTRIAVVKYARSGIFGAIILGLGRALGETMAVTMTIGNGLTVNSSLIQGGRSIASEIANAWPEAASQPLQQSALLELGLVLLLITLLINIVARLLLSRLLSVEEARE